MAEEEFTLKKLTEHQSAKAEELAQMVVSHDSYVHPGHLVKKTHKREFQVEVRHDDNISMEGSFHEKVMIQDPTRTNERDYSLRTVEDGNQVDPLRMMKCTQSNDVDSRHKDIHALHTKVDNTPTKSTSSYGHIWEGILQLKYRGVTLLALFKSGDKISTKKWPSLLEIKGRVKVEEFTRFLGELRLSKAREIMVVHVLLKKGSSENARKCLRETIDDYAAQDRVALLAPVPGVDLYLCPPSWKSVRMLRSFVREEHAVGLASSPHGFVGLVLRKRDQLVTPPTVSSSFPSSSSRHGQPRISSGGQSVYKTQPRPNFDPVSLQQPSRRDPVPVPNEGPAKEDEDDIPPGFGPAVDMDSHPEVEAYMPQPVGPMFLREQQMRELIHNFGHHENPGVTPVGHFEIPTEPWEDDDDDDDLPEWQPHLDNFLQSRALTSQPSQLHGFQVRHQPTQPMRCLSNQLPAAVSVPLIQHPTTAGASFPPQLAPPHPALLQTSSMQGSHRMQSGALWRPRAPVHVWSSANGSQLPSYYGDGRLVEGQLYDERRGFGDPRVVMERRYPPSRRGV